MSKQMPSDVRELAALRERNLVLKNAVAESAMAAEHKYAILQNTLTQLTTGLLAGTPGQTNLTSFNPALANNIYAPLTLNWVTLMYMYKTHGIIQTAIDVPVLDALRGRVEITSGELDEEDIGELEEDMEEGLVWDSVQDGTIWARLFGGGAIIANVEGEDYEEPLDWDRLGGKKIEFYDACRWELGSEQRLPASGYYQFYGHNVHESRVLTLSGKRPPFLLRYQLAGWGFSEIERMLEDFNMYIRNKNAIYELLAEAKVDVYQLKGFNNQLSSSAGTQSTQNRVQMANQVKNFMNALLLDAEDKYEQKQVGFGGLGEMMKENRINIASALRMPLTKIFGISASGFNSGEDDIENYNSMVESEIRTPLRSVIRKVLKLCMAAKFGRVLDFDFKYKPLRILSAVDEENVQTLKHNRLMSLYDKALVTAEELMQMERKEGLITVKTAAEDGAMVPHATERGGEVGGAGDSEAGAFGGSEELPEAGMPGTGFDSGAGTEVDAMSPADKEGRA